MFNILNRGGKFPPAPDVLDGAEYDVEYVSPLARAQRQSEANGLLRVFEIGSPIIQMQPDSAQIINGEDTIRYLGDLFGVPNSLFKSPEEMAQIKQQQQEMMQLQQGLQAAGQGADVLQKLQ